MNFVKLYGIGLVAFLAIDLVWLGVVAKGLYQKHLGHLMRTDVQWVPAVLFYMIFVAAIVVFVVQPAIERQSLTRAIGMGAFFGFAAYATFDLTCMALFKDFPASIAVIDLIWGAVLTASVSAVVYLAA